MAYIPSWLIGFLSPILNLDFVAKKIPEEIRSTAILALCAAVMGITVWVTPLTMQSFPTEMWALFCLITGAYTVTKPVDGMKPGSAVLAVLAGGILLLAPFVAQAQLAAPPEAYQPSTVGSGDVVASLIGALIARFLKKWKWLRP
jgi:uncharacterized membrane protein